MKIAILGCGWLGLPLAESLVKNGQQVVGSKRTAQGVAQLAQLGIQGVEFQLGDNLDKLSAAFACDVLVLNMPVGRKSQTPERFVSQISELIARAKYSAVKHLVFVSTTSVYGEATRVVHEDSPLNPVTASAKVNARIESEVRRIFAQQATILRLAGLVGGQRHPGKFLAGKTDLANPHQVVNLVHLDDVIRAIRRIIDKGIWGQDLHLSASDHPTRQDYYSWAATQLGLQAPQFVQQCSSTPSGKQVDCQRTLSQLQMQLKHPSPYHMLQAR